MPKMFDNMDIQQIQQMLQAAAAQKQQSATKTEEDIPNIESFESVQ